MKLPFIFQSVRHAYLQAPMQFMFIFAYGPTALYMTYAMMFWGDTTWQRYWLAGLMLATALMLVTLLKTLALTNAKLADMEQGSLQSTTTKLAKYHILP